MLLGQGQCINVPVLGFLLDLSLTTKNSMIPHNALADARALSIDYALKYAHKIVKWVGIEISHKKVAFYNIILQFNL